MQQPSAPQASLSQSHEVAQRALRQLLALAASDDTSNITLNVQMPALPLRFRVGEATAAVLAATGKLAADLWDLRRGETQQITVSTRAASASLLSFTLQQFEDPEKAPPPRLDPEQRTAFAGFHQTRDDRFFYLHPGLPHHTAGLRRLLDCEETKPAVAQTVARWQAQALEEAIAHAGLCGAMVRSPHEWDTSNQGRMLAARPVVEVIKIGESDPIPLPQSAEMPLAGIRVVDCTRLLAGPTCTRTLAQYGAEVLHIGTATLPDVPLFVTDTGHGKLSAYLDLKTDHGKTCLLDLVQQSDVFAQGYRTGALDRLGFSPTRLAEWKPGVIYTTINCYGHEGGWQHRRGFEQLAQIVTGMAVLHGGAEAPALLGIPGKDSTTVGIAVNDYTTGYLAAFGTMVALKWRALYGGSYLVRASLCQTGVWIRQLGLTPDADMQQVWALSEDEIARYSTVSDTPWGRLHHLTPCVELSRTPARWTRPVVLPGTHPPAWPVE